MVILYILGLVIVSFPIALALLIGPKPNKERLIYMVTGFIVASFVGFILVLINLKTKFSNPESTIAVVSTYALAGFAEEVFRYPAILLAIFLGKRYTPIREVIIDQDEKLNWLKIKDPHGIGIYFGVGWGYFETIVYYFYPVFQDFITGQEWIMVEHLQPVAYRVTAVMAHVALTYLAMIITINRSFYRFTILLHVGVNTINNLFDVIAPSVPAKIMFVIFSRFALTVIVYYLLRPKARFLSPAVLLLIEVLLFLLFIILGSLVFLISMLLGADIFTF